MDLDPPFPANAIKDPFGYSGDETSVVYSPHRHHQPAAVCYPWGYDSPRPSSPPVYVPFTFPWSLPIYHPLTDFSSTIAPDEVMVTGLHPEQQPAADTSYTAAPTPFDSPPGDDSTPTSLPQLLTDTSDDSDSEHGTPIDPRARRFDYASQSYPSSPSGGSVTGSVLQGEMVEADLEGMSNEALSMYSFGSLGLSAAPPLVPTAGLEAGEDDPFMDLSETEPQEDLVNDSVAEAAITGLETEREDRVDTPPLTPIAPATPTSQNGELSESESVVALSRHSSTRLVPGPGSVISDAEYVAAIEEGGDEEGEEELDDLPASPSPPPTVKRASSSSTTTKKTFKDGLWDAINNRKFKDDIFWAADGLSGEIPDRRQFERSAAMRAITDARNVSGFVRQLHMWGFHRFKRGGPHSLCFTHPLFRRDQPELRHNISRKGETKYRVRRTKRKQKKGTKSSTTLAGPEVRKSTRSSTRRNYKEEQSPAPSSDPELESDVGKKHFRCADCQFEEPRPIKRSRRGQGAGPSSRVKATKTESAGRASSSKKRKVSEGRTRLRQRSALTSDDLDMLRFLSPEPAKPSLSTIRPKSQRNHKK